MSTPKPQSVTQSATQSSDQSKPKTLSKDEQAKITKAVQAGQKIIKDNGTKVEAAMAIFRIIHDLDQDIVVKAFIEGASLTPKGALTYWYNCRRKFKKEQAK